MSQRKDIEDQIVVINQIIRSANLSGEYTSEICNDLKNKLNYLSQSVWEYSSRFLNNDRSSISWTALFKNYQEEWGFPELDPVVLINQMFRNVLATVSLHEALGYKWRNHRVEIYDNINLVQYRGVLLEKMWKTSVPDIDSLIYQELFGVHTN